MRETEKKKTQNNNQTRRRAQKRDNKLPEQNLCKKPISRESESKAPKTKPVNDTAVATQPTEVYENVVHYLDDDDDDAYRRLEDALQDPVASVEVNDGSLSCNSALLENETDLLELSDGETIEIKEETFHEACNDTNKSSGSDDEFVNADHDKIEQMEKRIERLEEELREVASLEISLYPVTAEHGSSAHKLHTPARRLSRFYIHASEHRPQNKRAAVARNTVSGLILVARTCGNDVPRLTFWLSNTVVLREIISQAFGNTCELSPLKMSELNGAKQGTKMSLDEFIEDWQETRNFTAALEKIESWIFSRIVESVWWQTLTPNMQPPVEDLTTSKSGRRLLGPALGDQQQGSFCIDLWKDAFQDAFHRLCPVRAAGHECGCLPVLARMVMKQCINRLDVAMFNAILRESANQIPTDPFSDPIVDSSVLPIPAGDLSFGSGAQLKNCVGNWFRWLADSLGMESDHPLKDQHYENEGTNNQIGDTKSKCFQLLDELSDLLMLPKDLLMDRSIRKEVCPSISLALVKRILCNFSPDEFCPDDVPGEVLEALNAESGVEQGLSGESAADGFPYVAKPVEYSPPSSFDVAEKVAEAGVHPPQLLGRIASMVQRKGYTSDDELDDLDSPLTSVVMSLSNSQTKLQEENQGSKPANQRLGEEMSSRFQLLREAWSG